MNCLILITPSLIARFWAKVDKNGQPPAIDPALGPCWLWTAYKSSWNGYGRLKAGPKKGPCYVAHRVSWVLHFGEILDDLDVLHKCDVPACVNPEHLFLGTHDENMKDRTAKNKQAKGSQNGKTRLRSEQVYEIRRQAAEGFLYKDIAVKFNIHVGYVSAVVLGKTWAHLQK